MVTKGRCYVALCAMYFLAKLSTLNHQKAKYNTNSLVRR